MGIWKRLTTVMKSKMNDAVDHIEDTSVVNQYVREAEADLARFKQEVTKHAANQFTLERTIRDELREIERLETNAEYHVKNEDDESARIVLNDVVSRRQKVEILQGELMQSRAVTEQLTDDVRNLETRLVQLRSRRDVLLAQAQSAKARTQSYKLQKDIERPELGSNFDRMEQKVRRMQATADAQGYMNAQSGVTAWKTQTSGAVEDELNKIKQRLQPHNRIEEKEMAQ